MEQGGRAESCMHPCMNSFFRLVTFEQHKFRVACSISWIMWNIIPIMGDTEAESTAPAVDGGDRGPRGVTISEN